MQYNEQINATSKRKWMKIWMLALALFAFVGNFSTVQAQQSILVMGEANVSVTPDILTFQIVIEERGALLSKLSKTLDSKTEKAIEELLDSSVDKKDIQSLNLSVYPWYERENNQSVQKGFVVSRQINVSLNDFTVLDGLIDKILRVGVKSIGGFRHGIRNEQEVFRLALGKAVENARDNAEAMTKVVNKKVGEVITLQQLSETQNFPMQRAYAMAEAQTPYAEGQMSVSASVQVEFQIQN